MSRGGRREGAGRPVMVAEKKRVQLSLSVAPETKEWLRNQSEELGVTMGRIVELCIESFLDECERESQQ
jgi:predicted DNA-binding protein